MSKNHTVAKGTMSTVAIIPNPDLLDLVKKNLPGDAGIPVMYSITGSLAFRVARLAGMVANAMAADLRKAEDGIDSYNDAMSCLDVQGAAANAFMEAGFERQDMITNLRQLLAYRQTANEYLATLVGESKLPVTIWADTLRMAAEPAPIDNWKLDYEWETYTAQCGDEKPLMTRKEYDVLTTRELSGQRSAWAKHISVVEAVIEAASTEEAIEFFKLDKLTQLNLLNSYATPERMAKFRASVMKRARSRFDADSGIRLHQAFVNDCQAATLHHRYANVGDKTTTAVAPAQPTPKEIAQRIKQRAEKGLHADYIDQAIDAEKRAHAQAKSDGKKAAKAKRVSHKAEPAPTKVPATDPATTIADMKSDVV